MRARQRLQRRPAALHFDFLSSSLLPSFVRHLRCLRFQLFRFQLPYDYGILLQLRGACPRDRLCHHRRSLRPPLDLLDFSHCSTLRAPYESGRSTVLPPCHPPPPTASTLLLRIHSIAHLITSQISGSFSFVHAVCSSPHASPRQSCLPPPGRMASHLQSHSAASQLWTSQSLLVRYLR